MAYISWEACNDLAKRLTGLGALSERLAVPARELVRGGYSKSTVYRTLKTAPGFKLTYKEGLMCYWLDSSNLAECERGEYYPRTIIKTIDSSSVVMSAPTTKTVTVTRVDIPFPAGSKLGGRVARVAGVNYVDVDATKALHMVKDWIKDLETMSKNSTETATNKKRLGQLINEMTGLYMAMFTGSDLE